MWGFFTNSFFDFQIDILIFPHMFCLLGWILSAVITYTTIHLNALFIFAIYKVFG